jgi:DNA-binding CsgD family transcriptional regulator
MQGVERPEPGRLNTSIDVASPLVGALEDLTAALADVRDTPSLATALAEALLRHIPGVSASYNEVHLATGRAYARIVPTPRADWWGRFQPIFEAHLHENPLLAVVQEHGHLAAATWTDVDPEGRFRSTRLFRDFYLPLGIEGQLVAAATDDDGTIVAVAVNRGRAPFTDAERAILDASLPLARLARRLVAVDAERRALRAVLEADGWRVRRSDEHAEPDPSIADLLRATAPPEGASYDDLHIDRALDPAGGREVLAICHPLPPHLVLERSQAGAGRLGGLGLTPRQAEVATLLAGGATNVEIGAALGISPATVKKHLEGIYGALGVTHRAGAVAALAATGATTR